MKATKRNSNDIASRIGSHFITWMLLSKNTVEANLSRFCLVTVFCAIIYVQNTLALTSGPFAILVEITHVCGENLGTVEFELAGDPNGYTYYWEHGPTTLRLEDLQPGFYTLVVVDKYGCVETYEVEILRINDCYMTYVMAPTNNPCYAKIIIQVFSGGVPIDESALNIEWSDGDPSGLTRLVRLDVSGLYCIKITMKDGLSCCLIEECIPISANPWCRVRKEIIVNEFNRNTGGLGQYAELMVLGNGECPGSFDLRGFHLDDNNGLLIPGNDFLGPYNLADIGINQGFLTFSYKSSWSAVPNGSLILIYSDDHGGGYPPNMPADDPADTNQDGVYVLSAGNAEYFSARSGTWDNSAKLSIYSGYLVNPSWSLVQLSAGADGMQVRYPDGEYCHGVSVGQTAFSAENSFHLWINGNNPADCNCRFVGTDFLSKEHFDCTQAGSEWQTPGQPNSISNADLIASLRDCEQERLMERIDSAVTYKSKNTLVVYPNPFQNGITLEYYSTTSGMATLTIHSVSGQEIHHEKIDCGEGVGSYTLKKALRLPPGVMILQFKFPSGEKKYECLIHANTD